MAAKIALVLALTLAVATAASVSGKTCEEYPYGWGYDTLGQLFTSVRTCLGGVGVSSNACAYEALTGLIRATEHEQMANSDKRKVIPYVRTCLRSASPPSSEDAVAKVENCLLEALDPYHRG